MFLRNYFLLKNLNILHNGLIHAGAACHFLEVVQPKVVFACSGSIDNFSTAAKSVNISCKFICLDSHANFESLDHVLVQQSDEDEFLNFLPAQIDDPDSQPAAIFFSSGSTGVQKGTTLSYEAVSNSSTQYIFIEKNYNMLWYSSLSWITGSLFTMTAMRFKAKRFTHQEFDPEETSRVIEKFKV